MAERLMESSGHDAAQAAEAILQGVIEQKLYIVWPTNYAMLWRLKRLLPRWFLARTQQLVGYQLCEVDRHR